MSRRTPEIALERKAYRPVEVAAVLGVSRAWVYRLIQEGEIQSIKVGHRLLIPAGAVDELLRSGKEPS